MPSDANKFSPNQQALLKIRELKQQLEEARQASNAGEPIAIVSMACRFPRSATSPELFWESLVKQVDEVGEIRKIAGTWRLFMTKIQRFLARCTPAAAFSLISSI